MKRTKHIKDAFIQKTKRKLKFVNRRRHSRKILRKVTRKVTRKNKKGGAPEAEEKAEFKALKSSCTDSGECISFGLMTNTMNKFFNNFDFTYSKTNEMRKIGEGVNGFVIEIPYERDGYKSYAVLKSLNYDSNKQPDKLYYEAFVGCYINKQNERYPCFIETYGCYKYKNEEAYKKFKEIPQALPNSTGWRTKVTTYLKKNILRNKGEIIGLDKYVNKMEYADFLNDDKMRESCKYDKYIAVLIQHVKNAIRLSDENDNNVTKEKETGKAHFTTYHTMNYLYQVYCPLFELYIKDQFIHHDLSDWNVVLYKLGKTDTSDPENKYIQIKYHYPGGETVSFNTLGISKIIDYGRCEFVDGEYSSTQFIKKFMDNTSYKFNEIDMNCQKYYTNLLQDTQTKDVNNRYFKDDRFLAQITSSEVFKIKADPNGKAITMEKIHSSLKRHVQSPLFQELSTNLFQDKTKLGTMDVYVDNSGKNMVYTPEKKLEALAE